MTRRKPSHIDGQLGLDFSEPQPYEITYGVEGSYVDIKERAERLVAALGAISELNKRKGFGLAAFDSSYSSPIWGRYEENTEAVLAGAERNAESYAEEVKINFWRATGYGQMRRLSVLKTGIIRERGINPRARKMWEDFSDEYAVPVKTTKERNKYKKQLLGNLALINSESQQEQIQEAA